jgi:hypothetical protein
VLSDEAGEQLRAWIATRSGLVTGWEDQPEQYTPEDYIELRVGPMMRVGRDGIRYEYDGDRPVGQEMVPTVIGQREFTLTVIVRAWSQELSQTAEVPLSQLELALQLPSFQQLLLDLNLGLIGTSQIVQADRVVDDRVQSGAAIDIRFATSIHLQDADEGQGYIATADVETTLHGGAGGDLVLTDQVGDV